MFVICFINYFIGFRLHRNSLNIISLRFSFYQVQFMAGMVSSFRWSFNSVVFVRVMTRPVVVLVRCACQSVSFAVVLLLGGHTVWGIYFLLGGVRLCVLIGYGHGPLCACEYPKTRRG